MQTTTENPLRPDLSRHFIAARCINAPLDTKGYKCLPFNGPNYRLEPGSTAPDFEQFVQDYRSIAATIVPWCRLIIAPRISVRAAMSDNLENQPAACVQEEGRAADISFPLAIRETTILLSSALPPDEALSHLFRVCWLAIEGECSLEYLTSISKELSENESLAMRSMHARPSEQRATAFAAYANAAHGGLAHQNPETIVEMAFFDALSGSSGKEIAIWRDNSWV